MHVRRLDAVAAVEGKPIRADTHDGRHWRLTLNFREPNWGEFLIVHLGPEHRVHVCHRLAFWAHHDVRVEIGGNGDRAVAEDVLDQFEIEPLTEQQ